MIDLSLGLDELLCISSSLSITLGIETFIAFPNPFSLSVLFSAGYASRLRFGARTFRFVFHRADTVDYCLTLHLGVVVKLMTL